MGFGGNALDYGVNGIMGGGAAQIQAEYSPQDFSSQQNVAWATGGGGNPLYPTVGPPGGSYNAQNNPGGGDTGGGNPNGWPDSPIPEDLINAQNQAKAIADQQEALRKQREAQDKAKADADALRKQLEDGLKQLGLREQSYLDQMRNMQDDFNAERQAWVKGEQQSIADQTAEKERLAEEARLATIKADATKQAELRSMRARLASGGFLGNILTSPAGLDAGADTGLDTSGVTLGSRSALGASGANKNKTPIYDAFGRIIGYSQASSTAMAA